MNRFVRGEGPDADANTALSGFERFPSWMWRNTEVLSFVRWLREWNDRHPNRKVGVYGLDLYSLRTSVQAVIAYLDKIDPEAAERARARYACFDHFAGDTHAYGYAASAGIVESCEGAVVEQLTDLQRRAAEYANRDGQRRATTSSSSPSRTRGWRSTRNSTTARCFAGATRRGTSATRTWPTPSTRSWRSSGAMARSRRLRCGRTTRTSATRAPRKWASAAR